MKSVRVHWRQGNEIVAACKCMRGERKEKKKLGYSVLLFWGGFCVAKCEPGGVMASWGPDPSMASVLFQLLLSDSLRPGPVLI
ncbi:hypothetical protein V6N12_011608 [Hibiscus sabdariffa]|uniref:Uncharacterized protein n=1 Tax=Hibiscus sabdariffa TaxID=183260 RepID=A0ABR2AZ04_9ROSI